jgi:hypothetical protein
MLDNPFGLTRCKKLETRHRTITKGEPTVYYHTYFEPKGLDKQQRRSAIDEFKHPSTKGNKQISNEMIDYALTEFFRIYTINKFDTILGIPSSSGLVKKVIDKIVQNGFKGMVFYKGFRKTRIRNIKLKQWIVDRENSLKTKEKVPKSFNHVRKLHYDKVSKSSLYPTRFRRYIENLLEINFYRPTGLCGNEKDLWHKKILVIDDTIGEGFTMNEVVRLLTPYTAKENIIGFTIMKDIADK